MQQTVLIGLGGTGSRVVNNVAKTLNKKGIPINDGVVTCAVLDTNQNDNKNINDSGSGIPVIPTCDERTINQYLARYAGHSPLEWCPYSPTFGEETMMDGASEIRVKSRIAFMDTMLTSKIDKLKDAIESIFHNRSGQPEKIRVMLVSSVAGGTGAGMFIQVAMWLRKFFAERNCLATIRGIFILPDVFVSTCDNIKTNARKRLYHYANAYACIRELNAINKIIKGNYKPEKPIVIDGLFDSNNPPKKPIFDNAFFIDNIDKNGAAFRTLSSYEEMVAQIVYMQLYAPMHSEIASVEDNLFRSFESCPDPVYGSCGTARAVYPSDKVAEYCALRAAYESVREGWSRIDSEIDDLIAEEKNAEKDGDIVKHPTTRREKFVELFEEKANKERHQIGRDDRFFVSIKKDIVNETRELVGNGNETSEDVICKVEEFMNLIDQKITSFIEDNGETDQISNLVKKIPQSTEKAEAADDAGTTKVGKEEKAALKVDDGLIEKLQGLPKKEMEKIKNIITTFKENSQDFAGKIIRSIVPNDMGSVNKNDFESLYGFFRKKDANGNTYFVHPVAAKYLLYKLSICIERAQSELAVEAREEAALAGATVSFDNPDTLVAEKMKTYWEDARKLGSKGGALLTKGEVQFYINTYHRYNKANVLLCKQFEAELLKQLVFKDLAIYVKNLITSIEAVFSDFNFVTDQLSKDIDNNVKENENNLEKILYVYATRAHKEEVYESLNIDLTGRNEELYEDVIKAVYGNFCAKERPNAKGNLEYVDVSVISKFYQSLTDSFKDLISDNKEYSEKISLDIIEAIHKESDFAYNRKKNKNERINPLSSDNEKARAAKRHSDAVEAYKNSLDHKAAPFLIATPDESLAVIANVEGITINENHEAWMTTQSGKKILVPISTTLTFWGFHPDVVEKYPELEVVLGANKTTAQSDGYGTNELYCYSSMYGIKAEAIPKFNEENDGDYFLNYSAVINTMIANKSEVDTPHLDKTWHEILPYVSSTMETSSAQTFATTFWKAIAYGYICLDRTNHYMISLPNKDSFGQITSRSEYLMVDGQKITATDAGRLLEALKAIPSFELNIADKLETEYQNDVKNLTTYKDTRIISGLMTSGDLNPATILTRYSTCKAVDFELRDNLASALRVILKDVASRYDKNRDDFHIDAAKTKLCYKIYELCPMATKTVLLANWGDDFKRHKLISETEDITGSIEEQEDII